MKRLQRCAKSVLFARQTPAGCRFLLFNARSLVVGRSVFRVQFGRLLIGKQTHKASTSNVVYIFIVEKVSAAPMCDILGEMCIFRETTM